MKRGIAIAVIVAILSAAEIALPDQNSCGEPPCPDSDWLFFGLVLPMIGFCIFWIGVVLAVSLLVSLLRGWRRRRRS